MTVLPPWIQGYFLIKLKNFKQGYLPFWLCKRVETFRNVFLSDTKFCIKWDTKFCIKWESRILVRLSQSLCIKICVKFTKSSYFLWRYKIGPVKAILVAFYETHCYSLVIVCAKFHCDRVKEIIVLDLKKVSVLYPTPPSDTAALQKSWIFNPLMWLNYRDNSTFNKSNVSWLNM